MVEAWVQLARCLSYIFQKVWSFAIDGIIGIDISPSFASLLNWSNDGNDALFQSDKIEW